MNILLWSLQGLLAALFLMTGIMKIVQSKETLKQRLGPWTEGFSKAQLSFIGLVEIAGAAGLILPMYLDVIPILTPFAAIGLGITMIGAIMTHLNRNENKNMVANIVILGLCVFVAAGRFMLVPVTGAQLF